MSKHVIAIERLSPGVVDHFCPPDAPDVVQDISVEMGSILLDHPGVDRLEITVEVYP